MRTRYCCRFMMWRPSSPPGAWCVQPPCVRHTRSMISSSSDIETPSPAGPPQDPDRPVRGHAQGLRGQPCPRLVGEPHPPRPSQRQRPVCSWSRDGPSSAHQISPRLNRDPHGRALRPSRPGLPPPVPHPRLDGQPGGQGPIARRQVCAPPRGRPVRPVEGATRTPGAARHSHRERPLDPCPGG